jgi:ATP-binding cassette subfamily B protein
VVLVDQEPFLFHTTIADNIRYGQPAATIDDVRAAARAANVDEFIASLPEGYQTIVGERGGAMSAGERQRIAIARALLVNPKVLVLDEPSAALDPVAERHVLDGYDRIMRGRTIVIITHRLALAAAADRVLVLGANGVVEQGAPLELRASGGAFAKLFA